MAAGEKVIGKLKLDTSQVDSAVKHVNEELAKLGVGVKVDLTKKVSAEVKKQLDSVLKEIQSYESKMGSAVDKVINGATAKANKKIDNASLREAIELWKQYYDAATKAQRAENSGNKNQADYWRQEASALREKAKALRDEATIEKELEKIKRSYNAAIEAGKDKQAAAAVREQAQAEKELERSMKARAKAQEIVAQSNIKQSLEDEKNVVEALIELYRKKSSMDTEATKAVASGNMDNANLFLQEEQAIQGVIDTIANLYPELDKVAQADDRVAEAELKRVAASNTAKQKSAEIDYKTQAENINAYADALTNLYNEQAKLNNAVASGRIVEGSEEYAKATEKIQNLEQAAVEAGSKLNQAGIQAANGMSKVSIAADTLVQSEARLNDQSQIDYLQRTQDAYNNLVNAIKNYNIAKKNQSENSMNYWQEEINGQMGIISAIESEIDKLNVDAGTRREILNLINAAKGKQDEMTQSTGQTNNKMNDLSGAVNGLITRYMSLMAVIRMVKELLGNMVDYVSEYYDKMNEIQIITGKSSDEVDALGKTYRQMAQDMSVSSLDMADAAIYFTRQGLAAGEIEKRLKNVTMYAKTANIEFKQAAELTTAVVNSMGLVEDEAEDGRNAVQRVVDVFLAVGDSAATSGQEIGEAMQKAAASAGAFGVSFEWLAAYIASVSATTRQEARTIGTAFNTIIARLHQIKSTGYNSEDETKINDVAKALAQIDVELMDQYGNWRNMEDIMIDIAGKWDSLDDKTRSYIATTMAGVKQQNVFLALMNDMAKGIEGGSQAWKLYETAMNSAGTAEKKYATYTDSVTAAQERLNVAQENFYALLQGDTLKGWYGFLTEIVTGITNATKAMKGFNIIIPVAVGLITTLIVTMISARTATLSLGMALKTFAMSHPVVLGITALVTAFSLLNVAASGADKNELRIQRAAQAREKAAQETAERYRKAAELMEDSQKRISNLEGMKSQTSQMFDQYGNKIEEMRGKLDLTNIDLGEYNDLWEELYNMSPSIRQALDDMNDGIITQAEAMGIINDELERRIQNERDFQYVATMQKYRNLDTSDILYQTDEAESNDPRYQANIKFAELYGFLPSNLQETEEWVRENFNDVVERAFFWGYANNGPNFSPATEEVKSVIDEVIKAYMATQYDMSGDQQLGEWFAELPDEIIQVIASTLWSRQLSSTTDPTAGILKDAAEVVEQSIDEVVGVAAAHLQLNKAEQVALRTQLYDSIFGEDGQLSAEEYAKYGRVIEENMRNIYALGLQTTQADTLRAIGQEMFGDTFDAIFDIDFDAFERDNPELIKKINDAYSTLIEAGFSNTELKDIYSGLGGNVDKWANVVERVIYTLRNKLSSAFKGENGESLLPNLFGDQFYELDINTLKLINDLVDLGVSYEEIESVVNDSKSFNEMIENLTKLGDKHKNIEVATRSIGELAKEIKSVQKDISDLDEITEKIDNGEPISFSDLLDLAEAHPEILGVINDARNLQKVLSDIRQENVDNMIGSVKEMIMSSEEIMAQSPFSKYQSEDVRTLSDLEYTEDIDRYVNQAVAMFLYHTGALEGIGNEWMRTLIDSMFSDANMDLMERKVIDAKELMKAGWEDAGEGIATVFSTSYTAGNRQQGAGLEWNQNVVVSFTPITEDGEVLTPEELDEYVEEQLTKSGTIDELLKNDKTENGGKGLLLHYTVVAGRDQESFDEAINAESQIMDWLHTIHSYLYDQDPGEESWLEKQIQAANEAADANWAKNNNYVEEIGYISRGLGHVEGEADGQPGLEDALQNWNSLDEALQKSIADTYPGLARAINNADKVLKDASSTTEDYEKAAEDLNNELQRSRKYATATHFTGTYAAIQKLEKGTISATAAYEEFNKELDQVVKAGEDITDVEQKMADGTEVTASDVSNLAKVLNMSADEIMQDWDGAVKMFEELTGASGELQAAFDALNAAAFIKITGTSEADFSAIQDGLISTQNMAQETIDLLTATGQWTVETIPLDAEAWVQNYDGSWTKKWLQGMQQILKPTGNNPYKGRSKGGVNANTKESGKKSGGGGGGGGNKDEMTEVERMLDRYSQVNAIQEYQQSWYQAQKNYYSQIGQLQGVIGYSQREIDLLKEQNKVLESNIDWIEEYIDKKQAELNALSTSDDKYEEVADDLDKLQQAHQQYTKQLIENKTSIDQLTQAIDEQRKKIREMEINLRNTILKAIQDREKRTKDILNAEIEMENKILDLITKRYEKERDQIIENTNLKIDSLNRESEMLDEQLRKRKELEEAEDKQKKLLELEAKYQRILADPTRLKEAKDIKQEIDDLRKEMAWDLAEEEVEAQKESIEQQTDSLEDYIEYVQNYYEDLFEHPQKLIDEMKEIMLMTDEEIINWLITNDEEFAKSTENTQRTMVESWQETLDTMHDVVKTYWEEVEYIISQGDDYILNFLKENMTDYREAGKLQAEAYVDEWKKQLDDLKKAYQAVQTQAASSYSTIEKSSGSGKSGGGGGGGGGGSGNKHGYSFQYNGTKYNSDSEESKESAETIAKNLIESLGKQERDKAGTDFPNGGTQYEYAYNLANKHYKDALKGLTTYGRGGLANFTGPAWLDGTATLPERVLSPYQTELFETMVQALEQISRITIPGMPYFGENFAGGGSNAVSVGDIIVNVDNLDTDADYEELAEKVGAVLMEQIGQTAVIGGLRIRSV